MAVENHDKWAIRVALRSGVVRYVCGHSGRFRTTSPLAPLHPKIQRALVYDTEEAAWEAIRSMMFAVGETALPVPVTSNTSLRKAA